MLSAPEVAKNWRKSTPSKDDSASPFRAGRPETLVRQLVAAR